MLLIVFNSPRSALLGLISAMYSLGAILALPFVPFVTDNLGRRMAIVFGSILMILGALLQGFSKNCEPIQFISWYTDIDQLKSRCSSCLALFLDWVSPLLSSPHLRLLEVSRRYGLLVLMLTSICRALTPQGTCYFGIII